MGSMSDLYILGERVLTGETIPDLAEGTTYDAEDISWATAELLKKGVEVEKWCKCRCGNRGTLKDGWFVENSRTKGVTCTRCGLCDVRVRTRSV